MFLLVYINWLLAARYKIFVRLLSLFLCPSLSPTPYLCIFLKCSFLKFSPWTEAPYKDAAEKTALGGLSLDGFLSEVFNQNFSFLIIYRHGNTLAHSYGSKIRHSFLA